MNESPRSIPDLGPLGIWTTSIRFAPGDAPLAAARELEDLGFKTIWIPGGMDDGVLASLDQLLDATRTVQLATGIINIWKHKASDVAAWFNGQSRDRQARLLLGLGVSHGPMIGDAWSKPVATMRAFLDELDAAEMPRERLCLAALGPKMLELSAIRTAGAHPYMVTAQHTAMARQTLGPDALLAPELGVVLETDPEKALAVARELVQHYAALPNYANNWRREGFTDDEIERLDNRLVDAVVAWGDLGAIKARVDEYHAAGADHVCLQAIGPGGFAATLEKNRADWRELAKLL
jgi:probable F420-dependent oxidoreductase